MKKQIALLLLCLMAVASVLAAESADKNLDKTFAAMIARDFHTTGIADKSRMIQTDLQRACSQETPPPDKVMKQIEAAQLQTIQYPADGQYFGNWKEGEKIAISGKGLTWTDKTPTDNGGGCYNCHQMSHKEISYGTIGPSLMDYVKQRGNTPEIIKYTWGKIWNAKAFNACSNMPRNGDATILTSAQIKDLMAYLFDADSPVNKP